MVNKLDQNKIDIENDYRMLELIKSSEYKMVFLYEEKTTKEKVIVKNIHGEREAVTIIKAIKNEHIPGIYQIDFDGEDTTVIEEYIEGDRLEALIKDNKINSKMAVDIVKQILNAVQVLHNNGVIHRDIKASNIIIDNSGRAYLIDYDASRTYKEDREVDTINLGTNGYAPPEQYGIGQTDERSDIYALGVLFNYLLTGDFPSKKLHKGRFEKVIERAISTNKDRRYQDVKSLERALVKSQNSRRRFVCVVAVVSLLFIAGISVTVWNDNRKKTDIRAREIAVKEARLEQERLAKQEKEDQEKKDKVISVAEELLINGERVKIETDRINKEIEDEKINAEKERIAAEIDKENEIKVTLTEENYEYIYQELCKKIKSKWKDVPFVTSSEEMKEMGYSNNHYKYGFSPKMYNPNMKGTKVELDQAVYNIFDSIEYYIDQLDFEEMKVVGLSYELLGLESATFTFFYFVK